MGRGKFTFWGCFALGPLVYQNMLLRSDKLLTVGLDQREAKGFSHHLESKQASGWGQRRTEGSGRVGFGVPPTLKERKEREVAESCPTLCDPMDYSPPGSSVHGIFQARVLEWVAISFSRGSS